MTGFVVPGHICWFAAKETFTVFYNRYDIFSNTSNNFSKLLTHQHTYNTQLTKQLI